MKQVVLDGVTVTAETYAGLSAKGWTQVQLPFCGFYETYLMSRLNDEGYGYEEEIDYEKEFEVDFQLAAKKWTAAFSELIGFDLVFVNLESPREYNFTTDRVYAFMRNSDLLKLTVVPAVFKEQLTSRDGFTSFYNYLDVLSQDILTWDTCLYGILFDGHMSSEFDADWEMWLVSDLELHDCIV